MDEEIKVDHCGRVILKTDGIIKLIKQGRSLSGILVEDNSETRLYNQYNSDSPLQLYTSDMRDMTHEEYDLINTSEWSTPEEFQLIDLESFLIEKCTTEEQLSRVKYELALYQEHDLFPLLRHLIYLVDHFRKNNIVWGVGRGSSVASYILFLIGIHKINSILYELDITEFLK